MTTDEIMKKIREGLTGEYSVDMVYLESKKSEVQSLIWHMRSCRTTSGKS